MHKIRSFTDPHVHARQGKQINDVIHYTGLQCGRFMVMPNTNPPICTASEMLAYKAQIENCIRNFSEVLMTVKLLESTTSETITKCAEAGCTAVKLYPAGVTTNSEDGISRKVLLESLLGSFNRTNGVEGRFLQNLKTIEETGMVLCIHGELPGEEVLVREIAMLPLVEQIVLRFPKLRVVLEHITTKEAVNMVKKLDSYGGLIAATITPHHLKYTLTDLLGDKFNPHLFCKPVLKNKSDQLALVGAAISGKRCFFMGSDSAPWRREDKECDHGCAGVWNAPVLLPTLFEVFDDVGRLDLLEDFTSTFADLFYKKDPVDRFLTVEKGTWMVPPEINGIVPFRAGQVMRWSIKT